MRSRTAGTLSYSSRAGITIDTRRQCPVLRGWLGHGRILSSGGVRDVDLQGRPSLVDGRQSCSRATARAPQPRRAAGSTRAGPVVVDDDRKRVSPRSPLARRRCGSRRRCGPRRGASTTPRQRSDRPAARPSPPSRRMPSRGLRVGARPLRRGLPGAAQPWVRPHGPSRAGPVPPIAVVSPLTRRRCGRGVAAVHQRRSWPPRGRRRPSPRWRAHARRAAARTRCRPPPSVPSSTRTGSPPGRPGRCRCPRPAPPAAAPASRRRRRPPHAPAVRLQPAPRLGVAEPRPGHTRYDHDQGRAR